MNITITVVEDNQPFRESLVRLIRSIEGLELVSEYRNGEDALALLNDKPDIVIVDIVLPGMSGLQLIKTIKSYKVHTQFLVCTSYDDDEKIFSALESGASGYILKDYNSIQIVDAIKEVYHGGAPLSPYIARRVINSFQKNHHEMNGLLTLREKEILGLASEGLMYKEIAEKLLITHETVKQHLKNIYQKMHVQNKIEAINKYKSS